MENRTLQGTTLDDTATHYGIKFIDYLQGNNVNNLDEIINKLDNTEGFIFIYNCMLNRTELWGKLDLEKIKHDTNKDHKEFCDKLKILFGIANSNNIRLNGEIEKITIPENYIKFTKNYIKESEKSLSKEIKQQKVHLEESQKSLSKEIEQQNVHLKKYTNKLNSIYSEFITILGIFTAITFAIFGGINTINSISSNLNISSNNPQNLGNLLIGASVLGIVLFGIITVFFAGIAKITEKDYILSPLLTISVLAIISAMFMIGLVFTFLADNWNLSIWPQIIISVVVIAIFIKCKSNKFKKS